MAYYDPYNLENTNLDDQNHSDQNNNVIQLHNRIFRSGHRKEDLDFSKNPNTTTYFYREQPLLNKSKSRRLIANIASPIRNRRQLYHKNKYCCRFNPCNFNDGSFPYLSLFLLLVYSFCYFYVLLYLVTLSNVGDTLPDSFNSYKNQSYNSEIDLINFIKLEDLSVFSKLEKRNLSEQQETKFDRINFLKSSYKYFTYCFIPSNLWHFISNFIVILVLMIPLELVHGSLKISIIFWSGILLNSLCGLSSGTYSIILAWLINLLTNTETMTSFGFLSRLLPALIFILLDFPINVLSYLVLGLRVDDSVTNSLSTNINATNTTSSTTTDLLKFALNSLSINNNHSYIHSIFGMIIGGSFGFILLKSKTEHSNLERKYFKNATIFTASIFIVLIICQILPLSYNCKFGFFGIDLMC